MAKIWDKESKEKAVRLVIDHRSGYSFEWAATITAATRLGMNAETLHKWCVVSKTRYAHMLCMNHFKTVASSQFGLWLLAS